MEITRPLDLLNASKDKRVMVELKNGRQIVGKLVAFDIHINCVLDEAEEMENGETKRKLGKIFLRGDTIILVSPAWLGGFLWEKVHPLEENIVKEKHT